MASGIQEHKEAGFKQMRLDRKAFKMRQMREALNRQEDPYAGGSYEKEVTGLRKVGSPPGITDADIHGAAAVDKARRNNIWQQQLVEYSAKLPNRYSSVDYMSQW